MTDLPVNARQRKDGSIDMPQRGTPKVYPGWVPDPNNPWHHYPVDAVCDCDYRIRFEEKIPCCGVAVRVRCTAVEPNIPMTYTRCAKCQGTEEGIAEIQGILER